MTNEKKFKGKPVLEIVTDDITRPLSFGVRKARLILENLSDIRVFVAKHEARNIMIPKTLNMN